MSSRQHRLVVVIGLTLGTATGVARAAGFDTPTLYSARHQGMGGTAIGYVGDPSATFHNPAGLQTTEGLEVLADFSPIFARLDASPEQLSTARSKRSELIFAPFFLLGASYRAREWLSVGLGIFPVASGGSSFEYSVPGTDQTTWDETKVVFVEASPVVSLNAPRDSVLPGRVAVGVGYRINSLTFNRQKGDKDDPRTLDLTMKGMSFSGYRLGLQWAPTEAWSFGVVYRNRIEVTTRADEITVFNLDATDARFPFVLPAKVGWGGRYDAAGFAVAFDYEYAFQSQNDRQALTGTLQGRQTPPIYNVYAWQDAVTLRLGLEYGFEVGSARVPVRTGYIYDGAVTTKAYPSAAGTPPTPTHTATLGAGYDRGRWQANVAITHRMGEVSIADEDLGQGCSFCAYAGDYRLRATGLSFDFSARFDL